MAAVTSYFSALMMAGVSLLIVMLLPLWIFLAVPIILGAIITTPLAFIILSSRVWIVYIDYFLTLFYRAVVRPNVAATERDRSYPPGEITRRYNAQNLHQYRYPRGYPPPASPTHSPPTLYSPNHAHSRRNSIGAQGSDTANTETKELADATENVQSQSRLDADMESAGVWEDVATVARQRSHRRHRSSESRIANAYLQSRDPGVGILPSIAAQQSETTLPMRRRSSGARHDEILRLQGELGQRPRIGMQREE